jgi:hypothetical protein
MINSERLEELKKTSELINTQMKIGMAANDIHVIADALTNYGNMLITIAAKFDKVAEYLDDTIDNLQNPDDIKIANEYLKKRTNILEIPEIRNIRTDDKLTEYNTFDDDVQSAIRSIKRFYGKQLDEINDLKFKLTTKEES